MRWRPQPLAYLVQFHRGVLDEVDRLDDPGRIERRSRQAAAVGRSIPDSVLRWALRDSSRMAADMARLFTRLDVLLTPVTPTLPPPTPRLWDRGAPASMGASTPAISFTNHWNLAGNPAASARAPATAGHTAGSPQARNARAPSSAPAASPDHSRA